MRRSGSRRLLITGLIVPVTLCLILLAVTGRILYAESFKFVFMTDIHVKPERKAAEGFRSAIRRVNELDPDFVITGGDMIFDALGTGFGRADSLYDLYEKLREEFNMPVYDVIGNHEIFGLYTRSGVDPDHPGYGKNMYMNRLGDGKTYRSFDFGGWHFILLDTIGFTGERRYIGEVGWEQLRWIAADLEKIDRSTPVVLVSHIPLVTAYWQSENGGCRAMKKSEAVYNSHRVLDLLEDYNLKMVLQGHLHIVEQINIKGVHFVTGGAVSGRWWRGSNQGFSEGFVVVDVTNGELDYHYETYGWEAAD